MFWAGIIAGVEHLAAVESDDEAIDTCGAPDGRPYRPHVTLARVKDAGGLRVRGLFDGIGDRAFGMSAVDAITLFQSSVIRRFRLRAASFHAASVSRG